MWSGLGTFGCDVAGEPWQTDLSLSSKVSLVVSLVYGFCVAVFLGFRDLLFSEAHVMNCSQSGPLLDLIGKCFQSVWSTVEKKKNKWKRTLFRGHFKQSVGSSCFYQNMRPTIKAVTSNYRRDWFYLGVECSTGYPSWKVLKIFVFSALKKGLGGFKKLLFTKVLITYSACCKTLQDSAASYSS